MWKQKPQQQQLDSLGIADSSKSDMSQMAILVYSPSGKPTAFIILFSHATNSVILQNRVGLNI
jgi:hypothetical protein